MAAATWLKKDARLDHRFEVSGTFRNDPDLSNHFPKIPGYIPALKSEHRLDQLRKLPEYQHYQKLHPERFRAFAEYTGGLSSDPNGIFGLLKALPQKHRW